jgi:hypothetical protein
MKIFLIYVYKDGKLSDKMSRKCSMHEVSENNSYIIHTDSQKSEKLRDPGLSKNNILTRILDNKMFVYGQD